MNPVRNQAKKQSRINPHNQGLISNGVKIIYIANARLPTEKAHGLQICKMCESFASAGHKVNLIAPGRFNHIKQNLFDYYEIKRNFKVKKLPCLDLIPLDRYIGHLGMWIETITFNFFLYFYLLFKKADIIYTRDWSLVFLSIFKKKFILEVHKFPKRYFLYSACIKKVKKIIVITQKLKELFVAKGVSPDKILIVPVAVDLSIFDLHLTKEEARQKLGLPLDKQIIGYFGRFQTMGMEKGVKTILEAMPLLKENIVFLGVGGNSTDIANYSQKAEKLKIAHRIILVEHVPQAILSQYQKACDVLLMPFPHNEHYAFYMSPAKMFEHMASQRPIVSSDLPSIREILNNENAVLVKPDNVQELAEGIKKVLHNKKIAQAISSRAFEDVQQYTWQKRTETILKFIR